MKQLTILGRKKPQQVSYKRHYANRPMLMTEFSLQAFRQRVFVYLPLTAENANPDLEQKTSRV